MACMKNKVSSSFVDNAGEDYGGLKAMIKPSMAEIQERIEESNRKSFKKEVARSDVTTRMKAFASI